MSIKTAVSAFAVFAIALSALSAGSYVNVISPYNATIHNNGTIYLGKVGPGQTFYITISSTAFNKTGSPINRGWNELVASGVQKGWVVQNSSLYTSALSVSIKPSPYALNGTYSFYVTAVNIGNYSKLGTVSFRAYVNVTPNVFRLNVSPKVVDVGSGEPANLYISINNTGVSANPFSIGLRGLPAWNTTETVFALHDARRVFPYPVYELTPGVYHLDVHVDSVASPLVYKDSNVTLVVKQSLLNDYSAIGQGTMLFPAVNAPAYAVMYLISLIFRR